MRLKWLRLSEIHHAPGSIIARAQTKVGLFEIRHDHDGYQTLLIDGEEIWDDGDVSSHANLIFRDRMQDRKERRFMAACAAMQGSCANPEMDKVTYSEMASVSVKMADALLDELEKEDNE